MEVDKRSERLGKKIAEAESHVKPPYIVIMGKRDVEANVVSVRKRAQGDLGAMSAGDLIARLMEECQA